MVNTFYLKEIVCEDKNVLHSLGDCCLRPMRQLFNGYSVQVFKDNTIKSTEVPRPIGCRKVLCYILLIPGLILGTLFKGLALTSKRVLAMHKLASITHSRHRRVREAALPVVADPTKLVREPSETFSFTGSQANCHGEIDRAIAQSIFNTLQLSPTEGIVFTYKSDSVKWSGGTCAAMSFDYAHEYLTRRALFSARAAVKATGALDKYKRSNIVFRSHQIVLSSYRYSQTSAKDNPLFDFQRKKVEAFAKLHGHTITTASDTTNLSALLDNPINRAKVDTVAQQLKEVTNALPQGCYIVNLNNGKLLGNKHEAGHVVVYIKDQDDYFYDPNAGTDVISSRFSLYDLLQYIVKEFKVPMARFFQIV